MQRSSSRIPFSFVEPAGTPSGRIVGPMPMTVQTDNPIPRRGWLKKRRTGKLMENRRPKTPSTTTVIRRGLRRTAPAAFRDPPGRLAIKPKLIVFRAERSRCRRLDRGHPGTGSFNLLRNAERVSLAFVFIAHGTSPWLRHFCERIAVMYLGKGWWKSVPAKQIYSRRPSRTPAARSSGRTEVRTHSALSWAGPALLGRGGARTPRRSTRFTVPLRTRCWKAKGTICGLARKPPWSEGEGSLAGPLPLPRSRPLAKPYPRLSRHFMPDSRS